MARACEVELEATGLSDCGRGYDAVLNGTAASLQGAGSPGLGAMRWRRARSPTT